MLSYKRMDTSIGGAKKLKKEATKNRVCKNSGQKEVGLIKDKFVDDSSYTDEMSKRGDKFIQLNNCTPTCELNSLWF